MYKTLIGLLADWSDPVPTETRTKLRQAREHLPLEFDTEKQFIGRQYAGCGATIGSMPRCDFACRGCYLNHNANRTPAESVNGIKQQLNTIRNWLGEGGNVQITDGEVTLRPATELIEIIRYAKQIGLVPMLMTHGDSFRKSPDLLKRLVVEAGLSEISIHIDTTQRGRDGQAYRFAQSEHALDPLRDEFAEMIRQVRRETGKTLEAATTVTVTKNNIEQVRFIIEWLCHNSDAFKMISFQPLAQVGRTDNELAGVSSIDELWSQIALGLNGKASSDKSSSDHARSFGHPACTRFSQGLVVDIDHQEPAFHPLFPLDDARAATFLEQFCNRFGGISFRSASRWQKIYRMFGILLHDPKFAFFSMIPFAWRTMTALRPQALVGLLWLHIRGKARINYLNIVSHHFMSRQEIETELGRERLDACVFKVPVNGELISMCEVNALGIREKYYATLNSEPVSAEHETYSPTKQQHYQ